MLSNQTIQNIKNASLNQFDGVSHFAISELTTQDDSQTFTGEEDRFELTEINKTEPDTYNWEMTLGLTDGVGVFINKIGYMQSASEDDLLLSDLLSEEIEKTEIMELNIGYTLTLDLEDNTTQLEEES
ncbi:MAG: hypothetical protein ACOC5T_01725 [Elusimicrobiota bacterium]